MSEAIKLQYWPPTGASDAGALLIDVNDPELVGKEALFQVVVKGLVGRRGGIDTEKVVLEEKLELAPNHHVPLPPVLLEDYRFTGKDLTIEIYAELEVKQGFFGKVRQRVDFGPQRSGLENVKKIVNPSDSYDLVKNFNALPTDGKFKVLGLGAVGLVVILLGLLVGWHDQNVPDEQGYFFDHSDSKGERESPMLKALLSGGGVGLVIGLAITYQLGRYIKIELKKPLMLQADGRLPIGQVVGGKTHARLDRAVLKVVAYNLETGRYRVKRKKRDRIENFKNPVRAICIFEQTLHGIPPHTDLAPFLIGEVNFDLAHEELLPPLAVGTETGIEVAWEVQLLHEDYIDHELEGDPQIFERSRFRSVSWVPFTVA